MQNNKLIDLGSRVYLEYFGDFIIIISVVLIFLILGLSDVREKHIEIETCSVFSDKFFLHQ